MDHIEQELLDLDAQIANVSELQAKVKSIEDDLNAVSIRELQTLDDESLSSDAKAKKLIECRAYSDVAKNSLGKTRLELYAAEDLVISAGINVNNSLCGFRDALRTTALREAAAIADEVFSLAKGESKHWAARARKVYTLDRIEALSFVGNNRPNSLRNLPKLRHIFTQIKALA
jgi:hypothetical protein